MCQAPGANKDQKLQHDALTNTEMSAWTLCDMTVINGATVGPSITEAILLINIYIIYSSYAKFL